MTKQTKGYTGQQKKREKKEQRILKDGTGDKKKVRMDGKWRRRKQKTKKKEGQEKRSRDKKKR